MTHATKRWLALAGFGVVCAALYLTSAHLKTQRAERFEACRELGIMVKTCKRLLEI